MLERETHYLPFDTMCQTVQCATHFIHNNNDYAVAIFSHKPYVQANMKAKLHKLILVLISNSQLHLDTQASLSVMRMYVHEITQLPDKSQPVGVLAHDINDHTLSEYFSSVYPFASSSSDNAYMRNKI